jgi:hypothetical protein
MSGYTVTITPSGDRSGRQTTVLVDTTSGAARVTELTVRAGGNGLSAQELPAIDLALLVAALAPGSTPAITAVPAATPAPAASTARTRQPRGRRAARKAAPAPVKATRGRRRAAAAAAEAPKAGRAYRRMPAQDDVVAAWNETQSASALAAHFDVPRHTAQGWLRRLRSMGVVE